MYEYRKLTPEERAEVVRIRRERGYPLHAPPHPFKEEGYFLINVANFEHAHIMHSPQRRTEFEIALIEAFESTSAEIEAWVVLPNHYHALVHIDAFERIALGLKRLHGRSSFQWNSQDSTPGRKVWYKYSDRKMRNEAHYYGTLNYIHHNPVKHGYVSSPEQWLWSSVHLCFQDFGPQWLKAKWDAYPLRDYGKGWDDNL